MPEKKKQLHGDIQKAVSDWFKWRKYKVIRHKAGPFSEKGIGDLEVVKGGRHIYIEIKTGPKDELSQYQINFKMDLLNHGGEYHRIWTVDQLEQMAIRGMI